MSYLVILFYFLKSLDLTGNGPERRLLETLARWQCLRVLELGPVTPPQEALDPLAQEDANDPGKGGLVEVSLSVFAWVGDDVLFRSQRK